MQYTFRPSSTWTPSILAHYAQQPSNSVFNDTTILIFARNYVLYAKAIVKGAYMEVIVVIHPYYPPDCDGPNYDWYYQQT